MAVCPHCGQLIETESEICSACGQPLRPSGEPAGSPQFPEQVDITDVKSGDYFRAGWEIFKKFPVGFVGYFILTLVITVVLRFIPIIGPLATFVIAVPLNAGFFVVSAKLLKNQIPEFADFFSGFKLFPQLALLGIVSSILVLLGFICLIVPGIYLIVSYIFALMLVLDRGLNFWPAMETSRRSVQTGWFKIFGFLLLLFLLNLVGILALGVGLLVTAPLSHCIVSAAYDDIFGIKSAHLISTRQ
jgi:uncharacterized membrane protein